MYDYKPDEYYRYPFQVWALDKDSFERICNIEQENWKEDWDWWRWSNGSNLGAVNSDFIINDISIVGWIGRNRESFFDDICLQCSNYLDGSCSSAEQDVNECYHPRKYLDMLDYLENEIGATSLANVCAVCIDLARQNGLSLSELLEKYM